MPVYVIFSSEAIAENDRRRPSAGRCRSTRYETGPSFASRIFSHAEARRARREDDWIFSASSAAPREPLYSPSSKLGKLKVVIRKTGDGGPGSADVLVGRCERIDSNPVPHYSAAANSSMLAQVNEVRWRDSRRAGSATWRMASTRPWGTGPKRISR